jgi:hypothetical protein
VDVPGRQGDPGSSRFYLSLEDPLLRIFGGERLAIMVRLKMPEGEAIEHPHGHRSLESAQRKVEQRNFDIRKQLLEYDDVANDQRKVIYQQRNELLDSHGHFGDDDWPCARAYSAICSASPRSSRKRRGAVGYRRARGGAGGRVSPAGCRSPSGCKRRTRNCPTDDILERSSSGCDESYADKVERRSVTVEPPASQVRAQRHAA